MTAITKYQFRKTFLVAQGQFVHTCLAKIVLDE